jgi:heptosyltransferase II
MMKILVIRYSAMGDLILLSGPLDQLKQNDPNCEIHLLTSELGYEVLAGSAAIDRFHILPDNISFTKLISFYKSLPPFDYAFDLQGKIKSQVARWLTQHKGFYTIDKQNRQRQLFVKKRRYQDSLSQHRVQTYWNTFAKAWEMPTPLLEELRPLLHSNSLKFSAPHKDLSQSIVIHPYASQKNKQWPHTTELIERLNKQGLPVIIVGQSDEPLQQVPSLGLDLTNKTSPREMIAIIHSARALISTDSGPMHMAVGLGKPTLALFGPTTKEFGFRPDFNGCTTLERSDLDCRPCHIHGGNHCPLSHHKCMQDLDADYVQKELMKLLSLSK